MLLEFDLANFHSEKISKLHWPYFKAIKKKKPIKQKKNLWEHKPLFLNFIPFNNQMIISFTDTLMTYQLKEIHSFGKKQTKKMVCIFKKFFLWENMGVTDRV